jgi:hypothetical protein
MPNLFFHGNSSLADNSQFWYGIRAIIDSEHVILVIWDFVSGLGGWCGWLKQKPEGHPTNLVASNEAYCIFFLQPMHWYLGLIQVHRGWFLLYCYCCKWPEFSPICPMFPPVNPTRHDNYVWRVMTFPQSACISYFFQNRRLPFVLLICRLYARPCPAKP